jgi:hypothetical protein
VDNSLVTGTTSENTKKSTFVLDNVSTLPLRACVRRRRRRRGRRRRRRR